MSNFLNSINCFTDNDAVVFPDEKFSVVYGYDSPANKAREFDGGAANLDDTSNTTLAA